MRSANDVTVQKGFAERAFAKVKEKLASDKLPCQLCGVDSWHLEQHPGILVLWDVNSDKNPFSPDSRISGLPLVTFTCKNCGNTLLLNAVVLGLDDVIPSGQQIHD